ncbi:MAG TPA: DUF4445 domain-containing protein [Candidatus Omnitrophica bacterium]|nr:DUF4445 domain-containing protein [Candidatus Omnitrophota bacterium]
MEDSRRICRITFKPSNKSIEVPKGTDLLAAAVACGLPITSSCGGQGVCGRCRVIVKSGHINTDPTGRISKEDRKKGYVLACRTTVHSDVEIEVPPESRLEKLEVLTEEAKEERLAGLYIKGVEVKSAPVEEEELFIHSPLATKLYLKLPPPTLEDNISDMERLYREIKKKTDITLMQTGLANVKKLGRLLRESNWSVTVTLGKRNGTTEIVLIEPGDTSKRNFGIALDIGTTTIVSQLININTREVLGTKASYNPQASFGEDVITRIIYAQKGVGLERLHHAVIDIINELIFSLIEEHNVNLNDVTSVMSAGNTTMTHLLLMVDPSYIRKDPYVATANFMPVIRAAEAGIKINPRGLLVCLPGVSSYVGGDIVAGVIASKLYEKDEIAVLMDVGTNGEIVLGNKEWLVCCSSSAGPAFEGSGVTSGVRAREGAIQRVSIDPHHERIQYETIGGKKPVGICGSGYVSLLAELFKTKIIDRQGKILPGRSDSRVREGTEGLEYVVAWASETSIGKDIVITQADITNLIRSKGAVFTALTVLIEKMSIPMEKIKKFYVAGGFGNYLDVESAIWCGLLPDVPRDRIKFIGNGSLTGARLSLLSYPLYMKAREIAQEMTYIELSTDSTFMNNFMGSLFLPHTNLEMFPSLRQKV